MPQDEFSASQKTAIQELGNRVEKMSPEQRQAYVELRRRAFGDAVITKQEPWLVRNLPDAAGMLGGLIGGSAGAVGGPVGTALGASGGAALGGAAGQAARIAISEKRTGIVPKLGPTVKSIGEEAAIQGGMELVGQGIGRGIPKITGKIMQAEKIGKELREPGIGRDIYELNQNVNLGMTPGEMANRPTGMERALQQFSNLGMAGRYAGQKVRKEAGERINTAVEGWLSSEFGARSNPLGTGMSVRNALKSSREVFGRASSQMYAAVDRAAMGVSVPIDRAKVSMQTLRAELDELKRAGVVNLGTHGATAEAIFSDFAKVNPEISFETAQQFMSRLGALSPAEGELMKNEASRITAKAMDALSNDMERAAARLAPGSPNAFRAYQAAKEFYAKGARIFEAQAVGRAMEQAPERFVASVNDVSDAIAVRRGLTRYLEYANRDERKRITSAFDKFRENWIQEHILSSQEKTDPPGLLGIKARMDRMGNDTINVLFNFERPDLGIGAKGKTVVSNLKTLGEAMARLRKIPEPGLYRAGEMSQVALRTVGTGAGALTGGAIFWERNPQDPNRLEHSVEAIMGILAGIEGSSFAINKIIYSKAATDLFIKGAEEVAKNRVARGASLMARSIRSVPGLDEMLSTPLPYGKPTDLKITVPPPPTGQ